MALLISPIPLYQRVIVFYQLIYAFLQECVRGALRGKTIILVTHQVDFLHNVDLIMVSVFFPPCHFFNYFSHCHGQTDTCVFHIYILSTLLPL